MPEVRLENLAATAIADESVVKADANGVALALVKTGSVLYVLDDRCPHAGGPLSEGVMENGTLRCPWHERHFDPKTGACVDHRATRATGCHAVRVDGDAILVEIRSP